jgi:hypothetical protein
MIETVNVVMRERLARICHIMWQGWMNYVFEVSRANKDGSVTIPAWAVQRWRRQISTPYVDLSEEEKDSDRREADKIMEVIKRASD